MGDVVNLRRERKRKGRRREEAKAAQNRIVFGMTKAERLRLEDELDKAERGLEAHKIVRTDDA